MNDDEKSKQAELVKKYQKGNGKAGEVLYRKYQPLSPFLTPHYFIPLTIPFPVLQ